MSFHDPNTQHTNIHLSPARWVESQRSRNSVAEEESATAAAKTATTTPRHGEEQHRRGQQREPGKSQVSSQIRLRDPHSSAYTHCTLRMSSTASATSHSLRGFSFKNSMSCVVLFVMCYMEERKSSDANAQHLISSYRIALSPIPLCIMFQCLTFSSPSFYAHASSPRRIDGWRAIETCEMRERTSHSTLKHSSTVLQTLSASSSAREKRERNRRGKKSRRETETETPHRSAPISRELVSA